MKFLPKLTICLSFLLIFGRLNGFSQTDEEFLDMVARDTYRFFEEQTNPNNGLIRDSSAYGAPCSIAAVGFGLTAHCIAMQNKWITKNHAYLKILLTLKTFRNRLEQQHGFYYHFVDMKDTKRVWNSEISSIDTALFIAGALTAGEYFKGTEIEKIANELYERINWPWLLDSRNLICMGWKPESGFLPYYWDSYNELMIIYALAIGSPTYPIKPESWLAWKRPLKTYSKYSYIHCLTDSLFVHQYSHAWIDFKDKYDTFGDYYKNSVTATLANRQYCIDSRKKFEGFSENVWGLTACVGPGGYKAYGAGYGNPYTDGTVAPSAPAGSMPFAPEVCIKALRSMYEEYGENIYGVYGFKDSFNPTTKWYAKEYLGIDQGISLLMIENYKSGFVWKYFMKHPAIKKWQNLCMTLDDTASNSK